jgi:hypothetical protein
MRLDLLKTLLQLEVAVNTNFDKVGRALEEWQSKPRRMGCVAATDWFCKRISGFKPERLTRYTKNGEVFQHVVASNGFVRIDLAPYADKPRD